MLFGIVHLDVIEHIFSCLSEDVLTPKSAFFFTVFAAIEILPEAEMPFSASSYPNS